MAGHAHKKRPIDSWPQRPPKKQKRRREYHSDEENDEGAQRLGAVSLPDSDDDIHNATVDAPGTEDDSSSSADGVSGSEKVGINKPKPNAAKVGLKMTKANDDEDDEDEEEDNRSAGDVENPATVGGSIPKSKRNDPSAFANSLSKILATKLSSSKRADPVLARSAEAREASKAAIDGALDEKTRRYLKEQKRRALEKGHVQDVLLATNSGAAEDAEASTAQALQTERKLREVAKRGVIKMFNAVRAAQVKAAEAERDFKKAGVIGINRREEKVNELSKKGFLDLIASGGGGLKKGALEEA